MPPPPSPQSHNPCIFFFQLVCRTNIGSISCTRSSPLPPTTLMHAADRSSQVVTLNRGVRVRFCGRGHNPPPSSARMYSPRHKTQTRQSRCIIETRAFCHALSARSSFRVKVRHSSSYVSFTSVAGRIIWKMKFFFEVYMEKDYVGN